MKVELDYTAQTITSIFRPEGLPECLGDVTSVCDLNDDNLMSLHEYGSALVIKNASNAAVE